MKKRLSWNGLDIGIEYMPGDYRHGRAMEVSYGHFRKMETGDDGEAMDCYIGPQLEAKSCYEIQQMKPDGTGMCPDEKKYMIGFPSMDHAEAAYKRHMPPSFFGGIREVSLQELCSKKLSESLRLFEADASTGLPKVIEVRVLPEEKESENGYVYLESFGEIKRRINEANQLIRQGQVMPNYYGHHNEAEENMASVTRSLRYDDQAKSVFAIAELIHEHEVGLLVARRIASGDWPDVSMVNASDCFPSGTGGEYCVMTKFFHWDWLPEGKNPGIPGSKAVRRLEARCRCGGACGKCSHQNAESLGDDEKEPLMNHELIVRALLSAGILSWAQAKPALIAAGVAEGDLPAAEIVFNNALTTHQALPVQAPAQSAPNPSDPAILSANQTAAMIASQAPAAPMPGVSLQQQIADAFTQAVQRVVPAPPTPAAMAAAAGGGTPAPVVSPEVEAASAVVLQEAARIKAREARAAHAQAVRTLIEEALSPKSTFEGFDLSRIPVGDAKVLTEELKAEAEFWEAKGKPFTIEAMTSVIRQGIKNLVRKHEAAEVLAISASNATSIDAAVPQRWKEDLEKIHEAADRAMRSRYPEDYLKYEQAKDLPSVKAAMEASMAYFEKRGGSILLEAAYDWQEKVRNNPALAAKVNMECANGKGYALSLSEGQAKRLYEAGPDILLGATQFSNIPYFSTVALQRSFPAAEFLQFCGMFDEKGLITPTQYDGGDARFGRHFQFPIRCYKGAPLNYSNFLLASENQPVVEVTSKEDRDQAFADEYGVGFRVADREVNWLLSGPLRYDLIGSMMADLMLDISRSKSRRAITMISNTCRKFGAVQATAETTINAAEFTAAASFSTFAVNGVVVGTRFATTDGSTTDKEDPTYGGLGIKAVVRLLCGQSAGTGASTQPRLIVRPERKLVWNESSNVISVASTPDFPIAVTLNGVATAVEGDLRYIDGAGYHIVPKQPGQTPHYAVEPNLGLLCISTACTSVTTQAHVTNLSYYYNTANVLRHTLTLSGSETRAENINKLLEGMNAKAALKGQRQLITPEVSLWDQGFGRGVVTRAKMWEANSQRMAYMLNAGFASSNVVGQFGMLNHWCSNAELLGTAGHPTAVVFPTIKRWDTKYAMSYGMQVAVPQQGFVLPTGSAASDFSGANVLPTNTRTWKWSWSDVFKTPRVKLSGSILHEPSFETYLDGDVEAVLAGG